ncbi:hypothetical protein [Afipia sp. DC4300-2b1]|uniref:hypothetical protein n=1 Tax=Afipia sp. DC4300-2b1 TaxID=2804672 RepID=UPI003CF0D51D
MFQTVEPCGERSFVGRRFVSFPFAATVAVRAVRHLLSTPHAPSRDFREKRPATHENRADHTDGIRSSQDCLIDMYRFEITYEIGEKIRSLRALAALR